MLYLNNLLLNWIEFGFWIQYNLILIVVDKLVLMLVMILMNSKVSAIKISNLLYLLCSSNPDQDQQVYNTKIVTAAFYDFSPAQRVSIPADRRLFFSKWCIIMCNLSIHYSVNVNKNCNLWWNIIFIYDLGLRTLSQFSTMWTFLTQVLNVSRLFCIIVN